MDVLRALQTVSVTRPLTAPATTVSTASFGRDGGRFGALWEATIWGLSPDVLPPERPKVGRAG
jgi:hypothetical protein